MTRLKIIFNFLWVAAFCVPLACQKSGPEKSQPESSDESVNAQALAARPAAEEPAGLAFEGVVTPDLDASELPGPAGPFVEPRLLERPREIQHVIVGVAKDLESANQLMASTEKIQGVPIGYPVIDLAAGLLANPDGYVVVAGKFARRGYAQALASALRAKGLDKTMVIARRYRHDRFSPLNISNAPGKVGRVFAGVADIEVPLLAEAKKDSLGTGKVVEDGSSVVVLAREETDQGVWLKVKAAEQTGYIPVSRVLVDYNVFPSPNAQRAILAVSLGCQSGTCRWDYWLVDKKLSQRRLVGPRAERLLHAFSPDGSVVAFSSQQRPMILVFEDKRPDIDLGPGTSPSWSANGKQLYFRRPGTHKLRDEVMIARAPDWKVDVFFDFRGEPTYPKALSAYPPQVDLLENGTKLYTMFYRLIRKDGGFAIHRWKVLLNQAGQLISKKGEQLTK
ncbi:MAG: PD40 domain-containing protein [Deltaproteobacteria bacterium]|nr:PD40 domain-containing protein [Deltaproteobacteria bacterium]